LPLGTPAPDFALPSDPDGGRLALAELRGRPVVLAFYPADWSPVCGDQIVELNGRLEAFDQRGAAVIGVSVDGPWSHAAFAEARGIGFPLLSDFEPKGAVARAYGVYRAKDGKAERALFLLDADGVVRWREVVEPWINPGVDGVLAALDALPAPVEAAR
jgi:peroxiredoxin